MNPKFLFWALTLLGVSFEIAGDIFFKKWTLENRWPLMWIGLIIYSIGTICWAFAIRYETLSRAISVFTILNLVIVALIGVIFFKEDLSISAKIGIFLGIISIILIERG